MQKQIILLLIIPILVLAACAPEDLDYIPTATPTQIPTQVPTSTPTPVLEETPIPSAASALANVSDEELVNLIVASVPLTIGAGAVEWRLDQLRDAENVRNVQGGVAKRVFLNEPAGGQANFTFGAFDSEEEAMAHYDRFVEIRNNTARGSERDTFPSPNMFGQGTYGSYALTVRDNIFVEVSVEAFSSTAGDPLPGLMRAALGVLDEGISLASEGPIVLDPLVISLDEALPDTLGEWERGETIPVLVEDGAAIEVVYTSGTDSINIYLGKFTAPSNAYAAYGDLISRGTVAIQINEVIIAVRGGDVSLSLISDVIDVLEPVLSE